MGRWPQWQLRQQRYWLSYPALYPASCSGDSFFIFKLSQAFFKQFSFISFHSERISQTRKDDCFHIILPYINIVNHLVSSLSSNSLTLKAQRLNTIFFCIYRTAKKTKQHMWEWLVITLNNTNVLQTEMCIHMCSPTTAVNNLKFPKSWHPDWQNVFHFFYFQWCKITFRSKWNEYLFC